MKSAIVVGGGIAGCTIAHLLAKKNWKVTLLERDKYLGGGFKTRYYGGHPYTLGPRPLISRDEANTKVFEFVNSLVPLRVLEHNLFTYVERDGNFYSYPIHEDDIARMPDAEKVYAELADLRTNRPAEPTNFEEFWKASVGATLYDKFIDQYSRKMWQLNSNTELKEFKWSPKGHALKSEPRHVSSDVIVAYPYAQDGFDQYFAKCTEQVDFRLNCNIDKIDLEEKAVKVADEWLKADVLINSISLDEFMDYQFGELPYIGRDFFKLVLPIERVFPENVQFLYYANDEQFLRVVEYKTLTYHKSPTTLLILEVPSANGKLYPLPLPEPKAIAKKYLDAMPKGVYTLGRLGTYTYNIDMDGIVQQAFALAEEIG